MKSKVYLNYFVHDGNNVRLNINKFASFMRLTLSKFINSNPIAPSDNLFKQLDKILWRRWNTAKCYEGIVTAQKVEFFIKYVSSCCLVTFTEQILNP